VRYLLEGSLRKAGNRIRVTAQLVEAETGKHVWAERYDRDLADIFLVQDNIAERARAMSPNLAFAHATLAAALIFSGNPQDGLAALQTTLRLDPQAPGLPSRLNLMACGLYLSGKYDAAVAVTKRVVRLNPNYPLAYRWLAAALGQLGRTAEAKEALEKAIAIAPATFNMYVRQRMPWHRPEDYAQMLEGLRKAGLPEE
jgi:adenylate cyclase